MRRARRAGGRLLAAVVAVATVAATVAATAPAASARVPAAAKGGPAATISDTIGALDRYWRETFPAVYGDDYIPVPRKRVIAGRPGVKFPQCQGHTVGYRDVQGNAFYCYRDNFVAYDAAKLIPELADTYGSFSVAMVLAHEGGHAIQDRAGNAGQTTILKELQADCFAGAWTSWVADDGSVKMVPGDLESALAALLQLRDAVGSSPDDPSAHGSAFDRVNAFQDGFESGPEQCASYFSDPPVIVQLPFHSATDQAQGGNAPAADVIPLTIKLLNEFYSAVEPKFVAPTTADVVSFDSTSNDPLPKCGGARLTKKQVENRVFYCISDGYFAFDEPFLQSVYDNIGDFGVASLLAGPWATYVQTLQGIPGVGDNTLTAVLQADCYTGGWVAAFFNGVLSDASLSPGDLDELIQAFLVYSRARGISADVPITFVRLRFVRRGFLNGYRSCAYSDISREVTALGLK